MVGGYKGIPFSMKGCGCHIIVIAEIFSQTSLSARFGRFGRVSIAVAAPRKSTDKSCLLQGGNANVANKADL